MTPETQKRLEYLRVLTQKYGSQYIRQYFGFEFKQFADLMGIQDNLFSMILKGKRNLTDKHEVAFNRAFEELKVMERTKDFKESELDQHCREIRKSMRGSS